MEASLSHNDKLLTMMGGHEAAVHAVRYTHDGSYCMTASADRSVRLWNPNKLDPSGDGALLIKAYSGVHGYAVLDVAIFTDKSRFVSAGQDRSCYLWDVMGSRVLRRFQAHSHKINSIALNAESTVLFTASYDQTVKCWDLRAQNSRDAIQVLGDFKDSVTSVRVTDHSVVAGSVDGCVRVYDLRMGRLHTDDLRRPVTSVDLSADGKLCLAACMGEEDVAEGMLQLLELDSGKQLRQFKGHVHNYYRTEACFSSDHVHVHAGDESGGVVRWNMLTGQVVAKHPEAHSKGITAIACHPKEKSVYCTASYDGTAKCWQWAEGQ